MSATQPVPGAVTSPQETVERALELSQADGCIVLAEESSTANLRWAGNTLTTNGVMRARRLTVVATVDGSSGTSVGTVSRSTVTPDRIESLVRQAEESARSNVPAEDAAPLVSPDAAAASTSGWDDEPAETSTSVFATFSPELGDVLETARSAERELFGFAEHEVDTVYLGTSTGVRLRHVQPQGKVEITGKSHGRSRSAWVGVPTRDFSDVQVADLDAELARRLGWAERSVDLPAGRYETLLPPSAVADLLIYLYWTATGRDARDGRTVFSRPGGRTRVGERLSPLPLRMWSDPQAPGLGCEPFVTALASGAESSVFDNGLPLQSTDWIRDGELRALLQTRHSARLTGLDVTPPIGNLLLELPGATADLEAMIGSTERGLLLTCLWYIREVDPQTLLLTGLTRDGVYLVEGGEVTGVVNNYRFNESPVDLLSRLAEVGVTQRTLPREWNEFFARTAMPAVRVPDFNMSTVSPAS